MNLTTHYLGLELAHPFVPSSTPLSKKLDSAKQLEDFGAAAIVMHSIFQEQIEGSDVGHDNLLQHQAMSQGGLSSHDPALQAGRDQYVGQLRQLKQALDIPIIASLNGTTPGDWLNFAAELEDAGADALELNVYYVAADITEDSASVEQRMVDILRELKSQVSLPIGVKLSPYFSSLGKLVTQLEREGASGIALFNRFYQPNIDLETLEMSSAIELSTSTDILLAMRWIAILHGRVNLSLAATGGIHFAEDAIKVLLCGADVAYLGSTLLANGPKQLQRIHESTVNWLIEHEYDSISQLRGSMSQQNSTDPKAFERGYYIKLLSNYKVKTQP
jgi:dihydroorotate dehydrogenase (fumarate)